MAAMTLDEEHPAAAVGFCDALGFVKVQDTAACQQCGTATAWEHLALAVPICSHVCFNRYMAAHSPHEWTEP
jgi:hypothetical protein